MEFEELSREEVDALMKSTRKAAQSLDSRAERLFDFAVAHPDGFTYLEAMPAVDLTDNPSGRNRFYDVVRRLRQTLGGGDVNLVCDSQGKGEPYLYRLVGTHAEAEGWASNRLRDLDSRFDTSLNVARSIQAATDGRSTDGRKARRIVATLTYLQGELEAIDLNGTKTL